MRSEPDGYADARPSHRFSQSSRPYFLICKEPKPEGPREILPFWSYDRPYSARLTFLAKNLILRYTSARSEVTYFISPHATKQTSTVESSSLVCSLVSPDQTISCHEVWSHLPSLSKLDLRFSSQRLSSSMSPCLRYGSTPCVCIQVTMTLMSARIG